MSSAGTLPPSALPFVFSLALCAARWLPTLIVVPLFAPRSLPPLLRAALSLALALPVAAALPSSAIVPPLAQAIGLVAKELGIGLLLAVVLGIPLWAVEAAGAWLDYQRGANPQALDPAAFAEASIFGALLQQAACVYLLRSGAFHALLAIVYASFAHWPPTIWLPRMPHDAGMLSGELAALLARYALILALPALLALLLIETCFSVLSRASARLPTYVAAAPFKSVALLVTVGLMLPDFLQAVDDLVREHLVRAADLFGGEKRGE